MELGKNEFYSISELAFHGHSHTLSLSFSLVYTSTQSLSYLRVHNSLTHTLIYKHTRSLKHTLMHTRNLDHSLFVSLFGAQPLAQTHIHTHSVSLNLLLHIQILSLSVSRTHTHTHYLSLRHTLSYLNFISCFSVCWFQAFQSQSQSIQCRRFCCRCPIFDGRTPTSQKKITNDIFGRRWKVFFVTKDRLEKREDFICAKKSCQRIQNLFILQPHNCHQVKKHISRCSSFWASAPEWPSWLRHRQTCLTIMMDTRQGEHHLLTNYLPPQ